MREALAIASALLALALIGSIAIEAPAKVASTILQAQEQRW
ncbi:hypothetical protein DWF04_005955 [Cereibacter sphaeroides f. sp. denitrificans]